MRSGVVSVVGHGLRGRVEGPDDNGGGVGRVINHVGVSGVHSEGALSLEPGEVGRSIRDLAGCSQANMSINE